jgi:hypothetical protein
MLWGLSGVGTVVEARRKLLEGGKEQLQAEGENALKDGPGIAEMTQRKEGVDPTHQKKATYGVQYGSNCHSNMPYTNGHDR